VKERAIACMGQIIANVGDVLQPELATCLPIFLERLRNEVTRLSSVKALTMIAASPLRVDLSPILEDVIPALGQFLRKNQRALKLNSLTLLDTIVSHYSAFIKPHLLQIAVAEVPPLLCDSDLHVAQLSLVLLTSVATQQPQALVSVHEIILPEVMTLVRSPLLQGNSTTFSSLSLEASSCSVCVFQELR
jgi:cullin-associated NEDD8-dissociated protein 1